MDLSDTAPPAKPLPLVFQAVKQNTSDDSDSSHPPRRNPPAKEKISSVKLFFFSVDLYHSQALLSRTPVIQKKFLHDTKNTGRYNICIIRRLSASVKSGAPSSHKKQGARTQNPIISDMYFPTLALSESGFRSRL